MTNAQPTREQLRTAYQQGYSRGYYLRERLGGGFPVQSLSGRVISTTAIIKGQSKRVQIWIPERVNV